MNSSTIAITGIAGLVGANLVRALLSEGRQVRALIHQDQRALQGLDIQHVPGDVCDPDSLRRAFAGVDVVYHLAALISLETSDQAQFEAVNVLGTRNVVNACLEAGVRRLVHLSSIHALEQAPFEVPVDENRPRALSAAHPPYDRSKAAGELEVRRGIAAGLDAVILNPTAIIGPYDFKPSYFGKAVLELARGRIPALVRGGFNWVDVRDVVFGLQQAARLAAPGSSYLLGGHWRSVKAVADQVAALTGTRAPRLVVPTWMARLGLPLMAWWARLNHQEPLYTPFSLQALRSNRQVSHVLAARDLNYAPRPFEETIAALIGWFVENGDLRLRPAAHRDYP